jgi:hypothetical protein
MDMNLPYFGDIMGCSGYREDLGNCMEGFSGELLWMLITMKICQKNYPLCSGDVSPQWDINGDPIIWGYNWDTMGIHTMGIVMMEMYIYIMSINTRPTKKTISGFVHTHMAGHRIPQKT